MSKVSAIYHLVINTYERKDTLPLNHREKLYRFIWDFLKVNHCYLYRINGTENHVHILFNLHQERSLAWIVGELKRRSCRWLKEIGYFPKFDNWSKEYFAFTCEQDSLKQRIEYIKNQLEHHSKIKFEDEMKNLCKENYIEWKDIYLG